MFQLREKTFLTPLIVAASVAAIGMGCGGGGSSKKTTSSNGNGNTNTASGTFTSVGSLATGRVGHSATLLSGASGQVLIVGGKGRSGAQDVVLGSAELYDPATGRFTPVQSTLAGAGASQVGKQGRMNHTAVNVGNGVLIIGGHTDVSTSSQPGTQHLNTCELYDLATGSFRMVTGTLREARSEALAMVYQQNGVPFVMIAGGRKTLSSSTTQLSSALCDVYRADVGTISPAAGAMRRSRYGAKATQIASGEFVIAGGVNRDSSTAIPAVAGFEVFDPQTGAFNQSNRLLPNDTNSTLNTNRFAGDMTLLGSLAAVIGGRSDASAANSALDTIEFYDEATNRWTVVTARLSTPRTGHAAVRLANKDILVIGGQSLTGQVLNTTEVISGSGVNASVRSGPSLAVARKNHTATLLNDGNILVVGGEDASGAPIASAEVFALPGRSVAGANPGAVVPGGAGAPGGLSLNPTSGNIGTQVTITNTTNNFDTANMARNIVRFNGVVASVRSATASQLTVVVPNGATTGEVSVQIGQAISTGNPTFTVGGSTTTPPTTGPAPFLVAVLPASGPMFFPVVFAGSNFGNGATPYFGNTAGVQLYGLHITNIPIVGSVSAAFSFVPWAAPVGPTFAKVVDFGVSSNMVPFEVTTW